METIAYRDKKVVSVFVRVFVRRFTCLLQRAGGLL
jgi:hypothetical protein